MRFRFATHEEFPIHVSGKCNLKQWPSTNMKRAWKTFCSLLADVHQDAPIKTHSFVLMKNHYHWLCTFDLKKDPDFFDWFHELIQVHFLKFCLSDGYFMEEAYIEHIENFKFYQNTYKYVYSNPQTAGLVQDCIDYPYSTLPHVLGKKGLGFPCIDNMNLIYDPVRTIDWINGKEAHQTFSRVLNQ